MIPGNEVKIFGNTERVAIRYSPCPDEYHYDDPTKYAICHLVINNKIIGVPTEECYLPTWFSRLKQNRDFILENRESLFQKEFNGLTDREIFESIVRANETEDEIDADYLYLPKLNSKVWHQHVWLLDETIDAYIICYYILKEKVTFVIEEKWPKKEAELRGEFIYSVVELSSFLNVLDTTIQFLEFHYPYLKNN